MDRDNDILEQIVRALKKDPDFPTFGSNLDCKRERLSITIFDTQQRFVMVAKE